MKACIILFIILQDIFWADIPDNFHVLKDEELKRFPPEIKYEYFFSFRALLPVISHIALDQFLKLSIVLFERNRNKHSFLTFFFLTTFRQEPYLKKQGQDGN